MTQISQGDVYKGSIILILAKWTSRILGLISTVIIARILEPADYGVIATAMIFIGLLDLLSMFGLENALIRKPRATPEDYNVVWTLQVCQKLLIGCAIFAIAPFAASWFDDSRLIDVIRILSISFFIIAFQNIGLVDFRKKLKFKKEFYYSFTFKVSGVLGTIALVFWLRSYWGLVFGIVLRSFIALTLSFVFSSYRPSMRISGTLQFLSFSTWEFFNNISRYVQRKMDDIFVARVWGTELLGHYNMAKELSNMVLTEFIFPISRAMVPIYSKHLEEGRADQMREQCAAMFSLISVVIIPICVGLFSVSDILVPVLLGPNWSIASELLGWLALCCMTECFFRYFNSFYVSSGMVRKFFAYNLIFIFILACVLLFIYVNDFNYIALVQVRFSIQAFAISIVLLFIAREIKIPYITFLQLLSRPFASAALMFFSVISAKTYLDAITLSNVLSLVLVGAVVYTSSLFLLTMVLSMNTDTFEQGVVNRIRSRLVDAS